jgi:DNA-binding NtrC family response regulator
VPARSPRVLLVDDELGVRRATQRQLESLGASVVAVDGVPAALETLGDETASVDLVLTDHRMPDRSGVELAGEAHARWPALPIILMSGDVETALAELGTGLSVIPLQKPFSRRELAAAVDHALRRAGLDDAGAPPTHGVTAVGRAIPDSSAPPVSA